MYRLVVVDTDTNEYGVTVYFNLYVNTNIVNTEVNSVLMLSQEEFNDFAAKLKAEVVHPVQA